MCTYSYAQTEISSIIGTESVDIDVEGKLSMSGSVIANMDTEGNDLGNLNINAGSFEYEDLRDFSENEQTGFSVGISTGNPIDEHSTPSGSTTIGFTDTGHETEGKTYATIGKGTITIADDSDISGINRDITNIQETTSDVVTGALDGSVTVDNRLFTEKGREDIANDFTKLDENLAQIGDGLRNNIVVKAIENAATDSTKDLVDAVKDYIDTDGKIEEIQLNERLTDATNGLTNEDAATVDSAIDALADIANENEKGVDGGIYSANDDKHGYAYNENGAKEIQVGLNAKNTDISDSGAVIDVIFHETTDTDAHSTNEQTAINRGDTAEGIWDLKNYGNENTNTMTGDDWYADNKDHTVLGEGNYAYFDGKMNHLNNPDSSSQNYYDIKTGTIDKETDTWESVTREINNFYGTDLTVEELKKINGAEDFAIGDEIVAGTVIKVSDEDGNSTEKTWKVEYDKENIDEDYWDDLSTDQKYITNYQRKNFYDYEAEGELGANIINSKSSDPEKAKAAEDWIDKYFDNMGPTGTHNFGVDKELDDELKNQDYRGKVGTEYEGQQFIWTPGYVDSVTGEYIAGKFDRSDLNGGTYDYVSPKVPFEFSRDYLKKQDVTSGGHFKMDVDPWLVWGNTPENRKTQSILERRDGLIDSRLSKIGFERYIEGKDSLYDAELIRYNAIQRSILEYERPINIKGVANSIDRNNLFR